MYNNTSLVISSTERQHTIISDAHEELGHDPKVNAMVLHLKGIQRYKRFQIDLSGTISKAMLKNLLRNAINIRSREKFKKCQLNFVASS